MIEVKNIHKTYQMGKVPVKALDGVSLSIGAGEFVAVMGPSGSGKSTLMHVLGLLDKPDSGEYLLNGSPVHALTEDQAAGARNRLIGFIFQQFHLLPRMSAVENVALPLIYAGKRRLLNEAARRIQEVGLGDRASHRPNELSGGQQQRVAIARSLVNEPLIILADEPTGNLDSSSKQDILSVLEDLNRQGKTVIIVTHEHEVASRARRVILMRDGRIVSDKTTSSTPGVERGPNGPTCPTPGVEQVGGHVTGRAEFADFMRQALFAVLSHKARSFLSILGILIGVAAVIAMLALGQGAKFSIQKQLASLGSNLLMIRPGSMRLHGVALESGSVTRFTFADVSAIAGLSDIVNKVSPSVSGRGQVVYNDKNWNTQVEGVGVEYESMRNALPVAGRFFTDEELKSRERVALVGPTVAKELFDDENPVGKTIKVNQINFEVIGVLPTKGASPFRDQDDTILMPVTTAMFRLLGKEYLDSMSVEVRDMGDIESAQEAISALIKRQHRLKADDEDSFEIRNMSDIRQTLEATTKTMSILLGSIAGISLLVGGIGIMNIMLVSVTERTREIGLRKALGARNTDIMLQFLVEAMLMAAIGGVLGIVLGSGTAYLITVIAGWAVKITSSSIILATVFSVVVGVVFGLWPARQASRLNPIEALRYE
jgi:macrolide transport system ATP-binding/permease protein